MLPLVAKYQYWWPTTFLTVIVVGNRLVEQLAQLLTIVGYKLSPTVEQEVQLSSMRLKTNKLVASAGMTSEQILYWTRVGDRMPISWRDQRIAVAEQNLRGIIPDAILIRVSTRSNNQSTAFDTLATFVQALVRSVSPMRRRVLIG